MIPLSEPVLDGNEAKYLADCISQNWVSSAGPFIAQFQEKVADYVDAPFALATSTGTAALHSALLCLPIKPDDEIIVPTISFIATANVVRYVGAHPIFMDCDEYLNLDPEKLDQFCKKECSYTTKGLVHNQSNRRVSAIMVTHLFGHPANMLAIKRVANRYNLLIIEDAAQAFGAYCHNNNQKKYVGTYGASGCYSFNGNKIITSGGGGLVLFKNKKYIQKGITLINQSRNNSSQYIHDQLGYNYKMTNVHAAIGLAQLERIDSFITIKRENFKLYRQLLQSLDKVSLIEEPPNTHSNYWLYSLIIHSKEPKHDKKHLIRYLSQQGIQSREIYYPIHNQKFYKKYRAYSINKANKAYKQIINLPSGISLTKENIEFITKHLYQFFKTN